jgi:collagen type VI alpha
MGQAQFWKKYYHSGNLTEDDFIQRVYILEREDCSINADMFFLLDGSGSISKDNFQSMRLFVKKFVDTLNIGPENNQVGMIVFGNEADVAFHLATYNNTNDVVDAIMKYPYPNDAFTNTADALCKLINGFSDENGARASSASVFRFAIVLTDGKSNQKSADCNNWNTTQAADAVHRLDPPVLVYVIGVTDSHNLEELETIASPPNPVSKLDSFSYWNLQVVGEEYVEELCMRASIPIDIGHDMNGALDQNETVRYNLQIPVIGVTVEVCVSAGRIVLYGSASDHNPNSAFYEFFLQVVYEDDTEVCDHTFYKPDTLPPTSSSDIHDQRVLRSEPMTLYLSVVGKDKENSFIHLNFTAGDVYPVKPTPTVVYPVNNNTSSTRFKFEFIIAGGSGLFVLVSIVIVGVVCGYAVHRYKKKKTIQKKEDEYSLLPNSPDYVEFDEEKKVAE